MANKMLIDSSHPEETRVVVVRGSKVEEFDYEAANRKQLRGNIYLAKVTRVEPSLQAAFIEYGGNRHGFLAFSEIHPDYYQIPVADRLALIEAEAQAERDYERDQERRRSRGRGAERRSRRNDEKVSAPVPEESGEPEQDGSTAQMRGLHEDAGGQYPFASAEPETGQDVEPVASSAGEQDVPQAAVDNGEGFGERAGEALAGLLASGGETSESRADADASENDPDESADTSEDDLISAAAEARPQQDDEIEAQSDDEDSDEDEESDSDEEQEEDTIEHVGGDALEEVSERPRLHRKHYKIQEVIKRRQILLVQVVKEERGNKGAALTTYLSLAGRYSVLMPNTARGGGISRKITSAQDRKRLKEVAQELDVPEGMGIILRTAGASRTKTEIKRDYEYLMRLWESVRELTLKSIAPSLVYEEGSLIKRAIRDLYNRDIEEIVVGGDEGYREAKDFMRMLMPSHAKAVRYYKEPQPLFAKHGVEAQLDAMFSNQVTLRSGGYLVINPTEALVSIDVNSGRSTREHSIEDTALRTNLEASEEIARQLRLRDLAGLIVIDFIDMEEKRNNRAVEKKLKDCLKNDRARIQVGRISPFGLMEMSRQRIRTGVLESSSIICPTCAGAGTVRATPSIALQVLRSVEETLIRSASHNLTIRTRTEVAFYILNQKRAHLAELENRFGVALTVVADHTLTGTTTFAIERGDAAIGRVAKAPASGVQIDTIMPIDEVLDAEEDELDEVDEAEEEKDASEAESARPAQGENGENGNGRRRRRRRRRRGRGGENGREDGAQFASDGEDDDEDEDDGVESQPIQLLNGNALNPFPAVSPTFDLTLSFGRQAAEEVAAPQATRPAQRPPRSAPERAPRPARERASEGAPAGQDRRERRQERSAPEPVRAAPPDAQLVMAPAAPEAEAEAAPQPLVTAQPAPAPQEALATQHEEPQPEPHPESPAPSPAESEPEPVAVVLTPPDPDRPKRAGWWGRAKSALTGS